MIFKEWRYTQRRISLIVARNMDRWVNKVAVVTGASSGIGAAIAEAFLKEGLIVVGVARRLENLEALSVSNQEAKGKFHARQCDITNTEELLKTLKWVDNELGGIDILVNNAAIWSVKRVIDGNVEEFRKLLDLNVLATAVCVREAVDSMQRRNVAGHIININSMDGHWLPFMGNASLYPATKFAITIMTETVRRELAVANSRIKITSVSPGFVKTDIMRASGVPNPEHFLDNIPHLQPKSIADGVLYVLGTPEDVQVTELSIRPVGENA
ncbi:farnesol dehydrogenase-like [Neodiprion fabricii]|uniref:farnesol dehydrogenase-like n=1 Tax=Neodiprion fabricii TaxID=2872261 RepID=UPI001ED909A7|nr:farnesol dehydrogenase-like [Neodiprion fabricii]